MVDEFVFGMKDERKEITSLIVYIRREGDQYVAGEAVFNITGYGRTVDEALENYMKALRERLGGKDVIPVGKIIAVPLLIRDRKVVGDE